MDETRAPHPASRLLLRAIPWIVGALVLAGWFSVQAEGGYFDPLLFGRVFRDRTLPEVREIVTTEPSHEFGYDGQFYVQMAIRPQAGDPALQAALDNAPYRLRRIGWPALCHALGLGQPAAVMQVYLWSNLACWLALAAWLWRRLMREASWKNATAWTLLVTGVGLLSSVRCSLLDLPALGLVLLAAAARERGRLGVCALLLASAALVKETSLLGLVLLWPDEPRRWRAWLHAGVMGALAAAPVVAWTAWLGARFGWDLVAGHENLALPGTAAFARMGTILRDGIAAGWARPTLWPLVTWLGLAFQLACLLRWASPRTHLGRLGLAFALLLLCSGPNVWGELVMAVPRAVLPLSVVAVIVAVERRAAWPWIAGHVLIALHGWDMLKLPLLRHLL
ncbi:MAG: DUF2029 domain-containing protein [Opitutaceae bacterium]|nr:DUF2029 domain-containing protein [Opitutaceae bacterium]